MKDFRSRLLCCLAMALVAACGGGGSSGPTPVVKITPAVANVMAGQQIQLLATTTDTTGNVLTGPVTWASRNTAVATVNSTGLVSALAQGQVTITATVEGQSGTATLTTTMGLMFTTVTAGGRHTCGLTPGGAAYCWGDNSFGQLGNGTTVNSATPVPVSGTLGFAAISAGDSHTCGATLGGAAYCWGGNTSGQLGNGTTINSVTPVPISGGHSFPSVGGMSAGGSHTCGLAIDGTYCWGDNSSGQLGNGTTTSSSKPVPVAGEIRFGRISAGSNDTCAVAYGGPFGGFVFYYCWGDNSSGQLGTGTTTNSTAPATPTYESGAASQVLSAGTLFTCAAGYGFAYCWGTNDSGQLGNGTTTSSTTPVDVSGGLDFNAVSTGSRHACGPVDSTVNGMFHSYAYCWGDNSSGQLGNGTMTNSAIPVPVSGMLSFATISAGDRHTCGVIGTDPASTPATTSGAVYCWGDNTFGQLGNNWTAISSVPVNVAGAP